MATTGEKIKRIRKEKGLTQKQLAELCNPPMADSAIRRYENDKAKPKLETIRRIARALDTPLPELADFSELFWNSLPEPTKDDLENLDDLIISDIRLDVKEQGLIHSYRTLNDTGQDKAIEQVELLTKIPEYQKDPEK